MSDSPRPESNVVREQLAAAGRRRDVSSRLASAATVGAMTLLLVGLVALIDYWLMLPVKMRWAALSGILALLAAGAWRLAQLWRRPTTLKQAALDFENERPQSGCEVSTTAEYVDGRRKASMEFESEMVDALGRKTATTLQQTPVSYQGRAVKPLVAGAVVGGTLLALAAVFPAAGTALTRAVAPWSKAAFTQLEVRPGSLEVPVGQDVSLTNIFTGRIPQTVELEVREEGAGTATRITLERGTQGTFIHTLTNLRRSLVYRVSGGDAQSEEFSVTAYVPPAVQELQIRIEPPAYTHRPVLEITTPDITAVRGSSAAVRITPNVPLSKARLRFDGDKFLELQPAEGRWTATLVVAQDTEYWIELFDQKGRKGGNVQPHRITAVPDAPPKVDFALPGQDIRAAATNVVPLQVVASDDFGVADIRIVYHKMGGPEQELVVKQPVAIDGELKADAELDLSGLNLQPYELVAYHAVARDHNTVDGPGVGRSPVYFIEITNEEGGVCKSKCKPGQKVNLLLIQKQIIADTQGLRPDDKPSEFQELAQRQKDALDFGHIYQTALEETGAPAAVREQMTTAVNAMQRAMESLEKRQRAEALPAEESALAGLYQALRLMPALENLPTTPPVAKTEPTSPPPPALKVVLQAIQRQKKQAEPPPELAELLAAVQQLTRQQASISSACQNPGSSSAGAPSIDPRPSAAPPPSETAAKPDSTDSQKPGDGEKSGESQEGKQLAKAGANQGQAKSKAAAKAGAGKAAQPGKGQGQGEGQGQAQAEGQGQGKGSGAKGKALAGAGKPGEKPAAGSPAKSGEPKPEDAAQKAETQALAELAAQEEKLVQAAKELAEKIQRAAGKASRQGTKAGQRVGQAATRMAGAAKALRQGDRPAAGSASAEGSAALDSAAALLDDWLQGKPELIDVSSEEAPRHFEGPIADYFKRLSHAQ